MQGIKDAVDGINDVLMPSNVSIHLPFIDECHTIIGCKGEELELLQHSFRLQIVLHITKNLNTITRSEKIVFVLNSPDG